jgi:hypothetical protein
LTRVLVVDWDAHHGKGTQEMFWTDPCVLYMSAHQYPFYPGTGDATEVGESEGPRSPATPGPAPGGIAVLKSETKNTKQRRPPRNNATVQG